MSKEKLLLVGAGGFGRVVSELARQSYDCAFVDDGAPVGTPVCGIPVVGTVADLPELRRNYARLVVVIGNNEFRAQLYRRAAALGYEFPNLIAPSAYISPYASLGWGCVVLNNALVQNGVLINPSVEIHQDGTVGDFCLIYTNSVVRTGAAVGRCARIGSNVTVCNNAAVPDGADVPDCTAVHSEVKK